MKKFILSLFILCGLGTAAFAASNADIQKAEDYLKKLKTVEAHFTQTTPAGDVLTGTFYLNRPGKLRFEYDEIDDFIVADGLFLYYYDSELKEQSNAPIGQTLADFLLREDIALSGDVTVNDVKKSNGYTSFTLTQTADPEAGSLQLVFSDIPFGLKKWRVIDSQGSMVDITLSEIKTDIPLSKELFYYHNPANKPGKLN